MRAAPRAFLVEASALGVAIRGHRARTTSAPPPLTQVLRHLPPESCVLPRLQLPPKLVLASRATSLPFQHWMQLQPCPVPAKGRRVVAPAPAGSSIHNHRFQQPTWPASPVPTSASHRLPASRLRGCIIDIGQFQHSVATSPASGIVVSSPGDLPFAALVAAVSSNSGRCLQHRRVLVAARGAGCASPPAPGASRRPGPHAASTSDWPVQQQRPRPHNAG